jgi:hypothetical protein
LLAPVQRNEPIADAITKVLIWALYFDNFPHGHYGTIRQQVWSLLHFPFQLAIVGVVEGSQQLALARYTIKNINKVEADIIRFCQEQNLDGARLRDALLGVLDYFELDKKLETKDYFYDTTRSIFEIGNATGMCAPGKTDNYFVDYGMWPDNLFYVASNISNGLYIGLGMKLPTTKLKEYQPLGIAVKSWQLVYMYYWSCFCALMLCLIIFLFLIRRHRTDLFDFTSIISRFLVLGVGAALLGLIANENQLYAALGTPALLPICVVLMFLVLVTDKLSSIYCNYRLKKSGQPYALEVQEHSHGGHEEHTHGEAHEHGPLHGHGHGHHESVNLEDARKSAHYSMYSDTTPLTAASTEYGGHQEGYPMESLMSPPSMHTPLMSPDPTTPGLGAKPVGPGGYMPVSGGQNFGA